MATWCRLPCLVLVLRASEAPRMSILLHDLAVLDDPLDFLDHQCTHAHCPCQQKSPSVGKNDVLHTLFADEGIIAVIRVVGISCNGRASIAHDTKVKFWQVFSFFPCIVLKYRPAYPRTRVRSGQSVPSFSRVSPNALRASKDRHTNSERKMVHLWIRALCARVVWRGSSVAKETAA